MSQARVDIQQAVTDKVIAAIEKGGLAAWAKPWAEIAGHDRAMPYNFLTGKSYTGVNILNLIIGAMENGYKRNAWLTFKQAQQMGATVRAGEKAQLCVYYKVVEKKQENPNEDPESYRMLKPFYLFNIEQIDGLNLPVVPAEEIRVLPINEQVAAIEKLVQQECDETQLTYVIKGNRACYAPGLDFIAMPAGEFKTQDHFAATLAHELVHATGHDRRLGRHKVLDQRFKDDDKANYAFEELVAELGALFICTEHGIVGEHLQHESYIDSWLNRLKRDKTMIFKAAKMASAAHLYVMRHAIAAEVPEAPFAEAA